MNTLVYATGVFPRVRISSLKALFGSVIAPF